MLDKTRKFIESKRKSSNRFWVFLIELKDAIWLFAFQHFPILFKSFFTPEKIEGTSPIVVWQMGKVGSSTLLKSLENAGLKDPIFRIHGYKSMVRAENFLKQFGVRLNYTPKLEKAFSLEILHMETCRFIFDSMRKDKTIKWRIITMARDPIATMISYFFQIAINSEANGKPLMINEKIDKNLAMECLKTGFEKFNEKTNLQCAWFDANLKKYCGIDVYKYPFDYKNGFSIIEKDSFRVIVMRAEDLNRLFSDAIGKFLKLDKTLSLTSKNISSNKIYSDAYQYALENIVIPKRICEKIYSSKYAKHFYSEKERERLIQKWSQKRSSL